MIDTKSLSLVLVLGCAGCPDEGEHQLGRDIDEREQLRGWQHWLDGRHRTRGQRLGGLDGSRWDHRPRLRQQQRERREPVRHARRGLPRHKTEEGQACHLLGHDGDEDACAKAFEMCAEICGL